MIIYNVDRRDGLGELESTESLRDTGMESLKRGQREAHPKLTITLSRCGVHRVVVVAVIKRLSTQMEKVPASERNRAIQPRVR